MIEPHLSEKTGLTQHNCTQHTHTASLFKHNLPVQNVECG